MQIDIKNERDEEYRKLVLPTNQELCSLLYYNITHESNQIQEKPTQLNELVDFINVLHNLKCLTLSEAWAGSSCEEILGRVIKKQQEEHLGLNDVVDVIIFVKDFPNETIQSIDIKTLTKKWKISLKIEKSVELLELISPFRINVLHKIFENVNETKCVTAYFKTLDSFNYEPEIVVEIVNDLVVNQKDFITDNFWFEKATEILLQSVHIQKIGVEKIFDSSRSLFAIGWTTQIIYEIVAIVVKRCSPSAMTSTLDQLCNCFEIAFEYNFDANMFLECLNNFQNYLEPILKLENYFHDKALAQYKVFAEKSLNDLLQELSGLNDNIVDSSDLDKERKEIFQNMNLTLGLFEPSIKNYDKSHIKNCIKLIREGSHFPSKSERIALIQHAYELFSKHAIREVQVLSLLLLYKPNNGTLAQINTGEGKTAIIAMLAALFALEGKKVDIGRYYLSR